MTSFAIVIPTRTELCARLHNRMPAALAPCGWPIWPGEERVDLPHLKMLPAPYPF